MNIIHAEERFSDKALMDSIEFKLWQYDRYWLGLDVQTCTNFANARIDELPYSAEKIDKLERLYMKWLIKHGDEVAERR